MGGDQDERHPHAKQRSLADVVAEAGAQLDGHVGVATFTLGREVQAERDVCAQHPARPVFDSARHDEAQGFGCPETVIGAAPAESASASPSVGVSVRSLVHGPYPRRSPPVAQRPAEPDIAELEVQVTDNEARITRRLLPRELAARRVAVLAPCHRQHGDQLELRRQLEPAADDQAEPGRMSVGSAERPCVDILGRAREAKLSEHPGLLLGRCLEARAELPDGRCETAAVAASSCFPPRGPLARPPPTRLKRSSKLPTRRPLVYAGRWAFVQRRELLGVRDGRAERPTQLAARACAWRRAPARRPRTST